MEIFFSVCIEVYNREDTIPRVLEQISRQTCRDFELIIVDNGSTDKSALMISKALYLFGDIETNFIKEQKKSNEISGWNSPLRYARGRYIAICEGDDYWCEDHLKHAKTLLEKFPKVGIYVGGSQLERFDSRPRCLSATDALDRLKMMEWCPPPSCIVFSRLSSSKDPYFFDERFVWAGEYSLYYAILMDGWMVIENNTQNFVTRGFKFYLKNSFHMRDSLKIRHEDYFEYSESDGKQVDSKLFDRACHLLVYNLVFGRIDFQLISILRNHFHTETFSISHLLLGISNSFNEAIRQLVRRILSK